MKFWLVIKRFGKKYPLGLPLTLYGVAACIQTYQWGYNNGAEWVLDAWKKSVGLSVLAILAVAPNLVYAYTLPVTDMDTLPRAVTVSGTILILKEAWNCEKILVATLRGTEVQTICERVGHEK